MNELECFKSGKKKDGDNDALIRNIIIIDSISGVMLFEKIYRWDEKASTNSLGSLIQSFHQLAREIDDGDIGSVNFESKSVSSRLQKRSQFSQARERSEKARESMKMICSKGDDVIVSVFCDMQGQQSLLPRVTNEVSALIRVLKDQFLESCNSIIQEYRPILNNAMSQSDGSIREIEAMRNQILSRFSLVETGEFAHFFPTGNSDLVIREPESSAL